MSQYQFYMFQYNKTFRYLKDLTFRYFDRLKTVLEYAQCSHSYLSGLFAPNLLTVAGLNTSQKWRIKSVIFRSLGTMRICDTPSGGSCSETDTLQKIMTSLKEGENK